MNDINDITEITLRFISNHIDPFIKDWEDKKWFPNKVFKDLAQQGFLGLIAPQELGGLGLSRGEAIQWCLTFGRTRSLGFSVAICMHSLVCLNTILQHGNLSQIKELVPKAIRGEEILAYAFTEPNAGSDLKNISCRVALSNGSLAISGTKTFITNGARATVIITYAKDDSGSSLYLVRPNSNTSRTKLEKLGWHCSDTALINFSGDEQVELLGDKKGRGWSQILESLSFERAMLAALGIGFSETLLEDTLDYTKNRQAFGKTLATIPLISSYLKGFSKKLRFLKKMLKECCDRNFEIKFTSAFKAFCCDSLLEMADLCLQFHGGYGYSTDYFPEMAYRDLRLLPIGGGAREVIYDYVYRKLKSEAKLQVVY